MLGMVGVMWSPLRVISCGHCRVFWVSHLCWLGISELRIGSFDVLSRDGPFWGVDCLYLL